MKWFFLTLFLFCQTAMAFNVFTLNGPFDTQKTTDVYVVGYGPEMATLFLQSAVTNARRQNELFPERQQLIVWALDNGADKDLAVLQAQRFNIIDSNSNKLTMTKLVPILKQLTSISSFHFFGHSSAWFGLGLQEGSRFDESSSKISFMKELFTEDAYAIFHGCNTGFFSAPKVSEIWEIPVLGSLTSTDFQRLHTDGHWYHNNEGQFPRGGWMNSNGLSFESSRSCQNMNCYRMKPNNHSYTGHWGSYEVGLPFMKVFCNFSNQKGNCSLGMVKALLSYPTEFYSNSTPSKELFEKIVTDLLCPRLPNSSANLNCQKALSGENPNATYFSSNQLKCDLNVCTFEVRKKITIRGTRREFIGEDNGNKTLLNEYALYLQAFDAPGSF